MTEPTPDVTDPGPLLTPADLTNFATIATAKAQDMIDDALSWAVIHAPCILDPALADDKRKAAKAIVRGAILRWNEAGSGAATTKSAGIYGQTVDTRQPRRTMFLPSEVDDLKRLCRPDGADDDGQAFSVDMFPGVDDIQHAETCSIWFGGGCSCGAILTQGLPLYENTGWA